MSEDKSKVDSLSDKLDSRTRYQNPLEKRSVVKEIETPDVTESWQSPKLDELLSRERQAPVINPFMKKFFTFAVLFFIATILIAGFVFLGGSNFVSSKNVDIDVVGPTLASAGEILELGVTIKNGNNTDLVLANFSVQYPQGSRDPEDTSKTLTYEREDLGVIGAGDEAVRNVRVVLLGSTGEVKEVKVSVEYKVKGSNATFYKDKIFQVTIGNAPLSLKIESPGRVASGETFTTKISVTLNSREVLKNVMFRGEYPYGYSVTGSSPQATAEGNLWALGDMAPGSTKKIELKGKLVGENQDERTFRFYIGVSEGQSLSPNFKTVLLSDQETIAIERPAVGLSISFNGENLPVYIAPAGRSVTATVRFQNNLREKLLNPRLEARLLGSALDKASVNVQNGGVFNPSNNRVNWNLTNTQGSPELLPGDSGQVSFSFASMPELSSGTSQEIALQLSLTGTPVGSLESLSVSENRTVKIASQVTLSSRAVYSVGPFTNSGPTPPKAGETTSYSIIWNVGNTQSEVGDAKVTARLGQNVKWVLAKSFASEDITYDEKTNTVTWNMGQLSAESGFSSPTREVSFQVALKPAATQVGTVPVLVSSTAFSGTESSSGKLLNVSNPTLTTRLPSDPAFIQGDEVVTK